MTRATITQCAVLTGGPWTAAGTPRADPPAAFLLCGDRPFLAWQLRELVRFGVTEFLLLGDGLSAALETTARDIATALPRDARIAIAATPAGAGSGGALFRARHRLDERFLLCNGEAWLDGNIGRLLAAAAADDQPATGRVLLRRSDPTSQSGTATLDGDRITGFAGRPRAGTGGMVSAGIGAFRRSLVDALSPQSALGPDILPGLAAAGALRGTPGGGAFYDIRSPEGLARARTALPRRLRRRAVFFDRDGVLNIDRGYVATRDRFEWMPGAREAIRHATEAGWHVFVATNQSGVGRGYFDEAAVRDLLEWMADEARRVGGTIDDARYCPFHEMAEVAAYRRASDWRKPAPGMLLDLIRAWELDPARCVMIGDQPTDMAAAAAAGIQGHRFPGGDLLAFVRAVLQP